MREEQEVGTVEPENRDDSNKRPYAPPVVRVMDTDEVLRTFQVTSAGISWWVA